VLAYGDTISSHIVEYDINGNQLASYSEATNQFFNQLEIFGDGRVGLSYDNVLDGSGTSQFKTDIIDLRTSGIPSYFGGLVNVSARTFAGTQFNDNVVGVNNTNNTYYYVGRNTTGQGPTDTFTGTLNNGNLTSWNTAIFADARSNYSITTVNGVTTITNTGDPAHAGTLVTTNVQELAFAPGVDPSPQSDGSIIVDGTVVILGAASANKSFTIDPGATLELDSANPQTVTLAGGTFGVTGPGSVTSTNGDAIDFTASGGGNASLAAFGAVTGAANGINAIQNGVGDITDGPLVSVVGQAGDGVIAEQSATGSGNILVNAFGSLTGTGTGSIGLFAENLNAANSGNITITQTGGASGGSYGIDSLNDGNGNIAIDSAGTVTAGVQYGIRGLSYGTGTISVVTEAGSVVNSGSSGIIAVNRDTAIATSALSVITVTNNGSINSGSNLNLSGSVPYGIGAGYNGVGGLGSVANTNVNGTVVVNNNANITAAAGYGIDAYNWGNGDVTVNDGAGTSVSGAQYGIGAYGLSQATNGSSRGTGNVAVNVAANATITGSSIFAIQAFDNDVGSVSVTTSTGDIFNSGSSGINAQSQATSVPASSSVTVIANGTIHSGSLLTPNGSAPAGIAAGYSPNGTNQTTNNVAGNVLVQSNATIVAAAGAGINAYNFGTGNVTVTTGLASSITAPVNGVQANALNGGNVSVTNAGSVTGATGIFAGANKAGNITVENDGQITATSFAGINVSQNSAGSIGSTTITNTGTMVGAANHSSINVAENSAGTVTINNSGTIGPSVVSSSTQAVSENGGTVIINNNGQIDGSINTSNTGAFTGTMNNNAGATWQTSYVDDEGTVTASGAGSALTVVGASNGMDVANTGTGKLTVEGRATLTADFLNIGQFAGSHGTVVVTGAGTTVNTTSGQYQNIGVGFDGTASMTIADQAVVTTTNMEVAFKYDAGVTDTLDINDATLNVGQGITIADAGTANATVENGGTINTGFLSLANQAGSAGSLTVTGAGSVVQTSGLNLGSSQSSATLTVSNGGAVDIGSGTTTVANAVHVGSSALLQGAGTINGNVVDDGTVTATGLLEITGAVSGTTGSLVINNGATVRLDGADSQSITFAGGTGTLVLEQPVSLAGPLSGLVDGDVIDLVNTQATSASIVGSTLTVNLASGPALTYQINGPVSENGFAVQSDGANGTDLVMAPVAEAPSLAGTATSLTVNEGGLTIGLPITVTPQDADDSVSITVTGLPADATLSAGTNNGGGSWTLTPAQLTNLQITTGEDTTATLVVTATNSDGGSASQQIALTVSPVPEAPNLAGQFVTLNEGTTITLPITMTPVDSDDVVTITVTGLPSDATLSAGTKNADGSWSLTAAQFANVQLTAGENSAPTVTVTAVNAEGGSSNITETLTVNPVAEAPTVSAPSALTVTDGGSVLLNINVAAADADDALGFVTISGVPTDATLSAGNNGGGTWTLTPAQLAGLTLTAGPHSSAAAQTLGTVQLTVTAAATDPGTLSATSVPQTINLTVQPMLWSSNLFPAQTVSGTHTYGAANAVNGGLVTQLYGVTTSGYSNAGPDTVTQELLTLDPFLLPYQSGSQVLATTTLSTFSAIGRQMMLPTLNSAGTSIEGLGFYITEDQTGIATINRATFSSGMMGLNSAVPSITSTALETGLIGQDLAFFTSFTNGSTGIFSGTGATYSVAWAQYNSATQNYSIDFQLFNPNNTTASPVVQILNQTGVTSATAAPAWAFRSAGTISGTIVDASAIAMLNATTGLNYIQFQAYNASNGAVFAAVFQIQPMLTAYAAGATNQITQEPDSPDHTYGAIGLQVTPNSTAGSGYSFAWNETVTDGNGTHDQVEFAIFKSGSVLSQSTFQIADGLAQNIRLLTANISGTFVTLMSYGDANGTHLVEFNQATGAKMASLFDPVSSTYTQMTSFNDGRIMLQSDVPTDANGTTQYATNIYDLRTSALVVNNATANDGKDKYYAETQYNDAVIGENGVNNTYYYAGQNTNTSGPTDSFTGGTGTGWNVAILPDAMSNYTITTSNGVTTLVNTGDPAHAGTLNVSHVQALAFAPTIDPSGNAVSLEVTGNALDILGPLPAGEPLTIDNGSTLELATADNGTVTFAGATGTLKIDTASSFTGAIAGQLAIGDVIDFADITTGANATIGYSGNNSPGTLTVSDGTHTASIALLGNYSLGNFTASSDGHGGTSVVDPPIGAAAAQSMALLTNYMASSFVTPGATDTGGSTTVPTVDQAATIAPALHSHAAAA
jgi:T5SS/PEP-CTERM-associated repeat protein